MRLFMIIVLFLTCAIAQPQFAPGEVLNFEISYGIITAGSVKMAVSSETRNDTIPLLKVTSTAKTTKFFDRLYKVRDVIEIEFYRDDFQSYRYHKTLREGGYRQNRINLYYPELGYSIYMKKDKDATKWTEKKYEIPVPSHDIFTTFFRIRSLEFAVGDTLESTVTEDGKINTIDIVIHKTKKMPTIFGEIDCYELEPVLRGTDSIFKSSGAIYIYLTADEYKIPVLLESEVIFGSFRATLNSYNGGIPD
jgi:hypothetical protein